MGITPPAISRLERNVSRATWQTLRRYAAACGVKLSLTAHH
ncbi:helix-turn-helix transcriptional regulator [Xenorhabdus sp. psl]|nr:helix-turn-helix transcriptional regulator [Xenorhabdus sp. psl]